jgi:NAD(P)H dehydrogenase (quinone)
MTVLVTGATGTVGPSIVRALHHAGLAVQALTRSPERAAGGLPPATELIAGSFADQDLVRTALTSVEAMVLLTPHGPEMAQVQIGLVGLAREAGVRVVKISGTSAAVRPDGPDAGRAHLAVEQELAASGLPYTILRPNAFQQTLLGGVAAQVRATGTVANPLGSAGLSAVDGADIGAATAAVLTGTGHDGQTYVLTGPAALTYPQIAAIVERVTGRPVRVVEVTVEDAARAAGAQGLTAWEAGHLREMLAIFAARESEYVTDDVKLLTGREPGSVEDFVRNHLALFTA